MWFISRICICYPKDIWCIIVENPEFIFGKSIGIPRVIHPAEFVDCFPKDTHGFSTAKRVLPPGGSVFVDDISRLFIYYVGRKRDQQLDRSEAKRQSEAKKKRIGNKLPRPSLDDVPRKTIVFFTFYLTYFCMFTLGYMLLWDIMGHYWIFWK